MPRPRSHHTGLPSYCYRDKRNGRLFMLYPEDGKLKRRTFATLDALLAAWRITWGDAAQDGMRTVGDLLDAFLAESMKRADAGEVAVNTAKDYAKCVKALRPVWGSVRLDDVDVPMIYRWRDARGEASRVRANRERTALMEAFKLAIRRGLIRENPVQHVAPFKEKPRTRYVTDAEFMAVYSVAPAIVQAAMLMAAVTGLRQGDILRLRRADFSEAGLTVTTGKTGKALTFGWSEGLRRAVLAAVDARDFVPMILLATQRGAPYTGDGFRTLWHKAMTAARAADPALEPFTFHDLRAKAGSESRDWRLLGHMDRRTFERVYNRLPRQVSPTR